MRIAGNGTGDTRWKVPGVLDWNTMTHNPFVDITKDTTTLYASDRDVFLFLVDDTHPIEAGRLADGSPDWYFRGFYCWNSEVGSKTLGIASFYHDARKRRSRRPFTRQCDAIALGDHRHQRIPLNIKPLNARLAPVRSEPQSDKVMHLGPRAAAACHEVFAGKLGPPHTLRSGERMALT